ncbi:hypothetical protein [uncultured Pseudomonas sp.]|uniref:hypothetical protein n=1 Tax=uncultured Pseudomonas sp. TaxID=114707 RepID=UPI0026351918|nr:hypothetical protein [uncultured Pseudomonas sp.]
MSIDYAFFDFREEHYSALYRAWLIIYKLSENRNKKLQLSIYKAQQIDHIVKSPKLFKNACQFLSGPHSANDIPESLYNSEVKSTGAFDKKEFLTKVMLLSEAGIVELIRDDEHFLIKCLTPPPTSELPTQVQLESQIVAIKGLINKSESVLNKIILGG